MSRDLFYANLNLVYKIAHKMDYGYVDIDDLIQVGLMALYRASQKFDSSLNTKFSSFASIYIIGAIKKELRNNSQIIISQEMMQLVRKIKSFDNNYSIKTMASVLKVSPDKIILALNYIERVVPFDEEIMLFDDEQHKLKRDISLRLNSLNNLEKRIIELKYLNGLSQNDIGHIIGQSQASVSRLEHTALLKMRNPN